MLMTMPIVMVCTSAMLGIHAAIIALTTRTIAALITMLHAAIGVAALMATNASVLEINAAGKESDHFIEITLLLTFLFSISYL